MPFDTLSIIGSALLFCLVFGMSATLETSSIQAQMRNFKALSVGLILQFIVLPLVGYITVKSLTLDYPTGLILLVIASSPGGSYSNWWCSIFNADLALSITMTALSTVMSIFILPLNLYLYVSSAYGEDLMDRVEWGSLAFSLFVVVAAVGLGLTASAMAKSGDFHIYANRLGNWTGIVLILFSLVLSNSNKDAYIWDREWQFYIGVGLPSLFGLIIANAVTYGLKLNKPERVTISIEACYQNVGIAMSMALSMFEGEDLARGIAVPFYFGMIQALFTVAYCTAAWKIGWTKAPPTISFWTMVSTSYEIMTVENDVGESHKEADGFYYVEEDEVKKSMESSKSAGKKVLAGETA